MVLTPKQRHDADHVFIGELRVVLRFLTGLMALNVVTVAGLVWLISRAGQ